MKSMGSKTSGLQGGLPSVHTIAFSKAAGGATWSVSHRELDAADWLVVSLLLAGWGLAGLPQVRTGARVSSALSERLHHRLFDSDHTLADECPVLAPLS